MARRLDLLSTGGWDDDRIAGDDELYHRLSARHTN